VGGPAGGRARHLLDVRAGAGGRLGLDRAGLLSGPAFTWGLRGLAAGATVAAFLCSPVLARRATGRALAPLAVATGLSVALAVAFLYLVLVVRVAP
jgi:hypothetical protein